MELFCGDTRFDEHVVAADCAREAEVMSELGDKIPAHFSTSKVSRASIFTTITSLYAV
jgi:hypothetical protein